MRGLQQCSAHVLCAIVTVLSQAQEARRVGCGNMTAVMIEQNHLLPSCMQKARGVGCAEMTAVMIEQNHLLLCAYGIVIVPAVTNAGGSWRGLRQHDCCRD